MARARPREDITVPAGQLSTELRLGREFLELTQHEDFLEWQRRLPNRRPYRTTSSPLSGICRCVMPFPWQRLDKLAVNGNFHKEWLRDVAIS